MSRILVDVDLARRLEEAESFGAESFAHQLAKRRPESNIVVEEVAGGRSVFAGAGSPLSETKAVGLHGPVTEADLDRMEDIFFSRQESSRVVVCPLADQSLIEGLGRRGYRLAYFEDILVQRLDDGDRATASTPRLEVRPIEPGEADLYASVVAPNFVAPGQPIAETVEMMGLVLDMSHASPFLAFIDGQAVGGGAVLIHRELALLAGAATLPQFRNRGVHAALHHARLARARQLGCNMAAQGAQPGSTSHRNAERHGFHVAYTRAILVRDPP